MKAISIWQPWTQLLATGKKKYETRSWRTNYRGPILLHASRKNEVYKIFMAMGISDLEKFKKAGVVGARMEFGAIIGMGYLKECVYITEEFSEELKRKEPDEYAFGDFTPGRYAWEISDTFLFKKPIPAKGYQGIWNYNEIEFVGKDKLCIMPENPYCPFCSHGYIEYPDPEDASRNIWNCLLEKSEVDEREA